MFCITIRSIMYVLCMSCVCLMSVLCMSYVLYVLCFVLCFVPLMVSLSSICHFFPLPNLLLNIYIYIPGIYYIYIYVPIIPYQPVSLSQSTILTSIDFFPHVSLYAFDFIRLNCVNPLCVCMVHIRDGYRYTLHIYARTMG